MPSLRCLPKCIKNVQEQRDNFFLALYSYIREEGGPTLTQSLKLKFRNYNIYVPDHQTSGPVLLINLHHIEYMNFTLKDTIHPEYIYRLAEITKITYSDLAVPQNFYQGTSSNVAVMDLDDNYVSLVT